MNKNSSRPAGATENTLCHVICADAGDRVTQEQLPRMAEFHSSRLDEHVFKLAETNETSTDSLSNTNLIEVAQWNTQN